jgi:hypothetical protein
MREALNDQVCSCAACILGDVAEASSEAPQPTKAEELAGVAAQSTHELSTGVSRSIVMPAR